ANESTIYNILRKRAERQGAHFTKEACDHLLALLGPHLYHLTSELDKLSLYVGANGELTAEAIDLLTSRTLESNVFALIDKVMKNKMNESFSILYDLLKQREEPIKLLALLARQFRIIFHVKELEKQGHTQGQIAKRLKLHPYAVK